MDFDQCLENRVSIRNYNDKKVVFEDIMAILSAARLAPSSGNLQNWSFVVVQKQELKDEISKFCLDQLWIKDAPVLIIVCSRMENVKRIYGDRGEKLYAIQNCAAAVNVVLLKAADLGLASCWINVFDENAVKRLLSIPETVSVQAIVTIGHSDEKKQKLKRYDLDLLVHFDSWNGKITEGLFPLKKHKDEISAVVKKSDNKIVSFLAKFFSGFRK